MSLAVPPTSLQPLPFLNQAVAARSLRLRHRVGPWRVANALGKTPNPMVFGEVDEGFVAESPDAASDRVNISPSKADAEGAADDDLRSSASHDDALEGYFWEFVF